jgi:hypothetical protein
VDPLLASAARDRLLHHSHVVRLAGDSYRNNKPIEFAAGEATVVGLVLAKFPGAILFTSEFKSPIRRALNDAVAVPVAPVVSASWRTGSKEERDYRKGNGEGCSQKRYFTEHGVLSLGLEFATGARVQAWPVAVAPILLRRTRNDKPVASNHCLTKTVFRRMLQSCRRRGRSMGHLSMRQRSYILSSSILVVAIAPFLVVAEASAQEKDRVYIIPDTQYYTRFEADVDHGNKQIKDKDWDELDQGNDTYRKQMVYIAGDEERTAIAIHMGDITHYNHPREWAVAQNAHSLLHGKVKYTLNSGNHDYPYVGFESSETQSRDDSQYLDHFSAPYQQFYAAEMDAGDWWGYQEEDADGNDSTFTSAPVNSYGTFEILGEPWVVVNLEFAPRKEALCWANDVIENQFSDYNVIIATHCYLGNGDKDVLLASDGERHNCTSAKSVIGANGEDTWRELVSLHNNIRMVHSGHVGGSEHVAEEGEHENEVWQFLTDYQFETIEGFRSGFNSGKAESYGLWLMEENGWSSIRSQS